MSVEPPRVAEPLAQAFAIDQHAVASFSGRHLNFFPGAVAHDRDLDRAPGRGFLHEARELTRAADRLAVELDDDVGCGHTRFLRRTALPHLLDDDAGARLVRRLEVADRHADFGAAPRENRQLTPAPRRPVGCTALR